VTVTCDVMFCLLCLCPNKEKEKETQNKIKKYKRNRINPSPLFATLIQMLIQTTAELKLDNTLICQVSK